MNVDTPASWFAGPVTTGVNRPDTRV